MARDGRQREVQWALMRVRTRRIWQAWLRFCRRFANVSNGILFSVMYVLLVTPTALVTRRAPVQTGWTRPTGSEVAALPAVQRQY